MDRSVARLRYAEQKASAARRGIAWEFTFDEWCEVWEGHFDKRGPHKDQLVMCRTHDKGPYRADNVRLDSPKGNAAERALVQKCAVPQWNKDRDHRKTPGQGFRSYGNWTPYPEYALEIAQQEYEWIPEPLESA